MVGNGHQPTPLRSKRRMLGALKSFLRGEYQVLIFSDGYGFCKDLVQLAPPGRIGTKSATWRAVLHCFTSSLLCDEALRTLLVREVSDCEVQNKAAEKYTEKEVQKLVGSQAWDLIIFALGVDVAESSDLAEVHKQQASWSLCSQIYFSGRSDEAEPPRFHFQQRSLSRWPGSSWPY